MDIRPLSQTLGAEIHGLDLASPLAADDLARLEQAMADRLVLVVRGQDLAPAALLTAVGLFGEIMPQHLASLLMTDYPEIAVLDSSKTKVGADGRYVPIGARDWHTDHAHQERPPKHTALYGVRLPPSGGDTSFANMQLAYAALPADMQAELAAMTVVTKIDDRYSSAADRARHQAPHSHPLIRTHPVSGKKAIFFHLGMVDHIEGLSHAASVALLEDLLERAITPDVVYRHQWQHGDFVIWDNRCLMHVAHADYDLGFGRILHRMLVAGDRPY